MRGAAERALVAWHAEERPAVGEYVYLAPKTTRMDHDTGYGMPNFAYGYAAQAVQVAVDTETGQVHIERFICADDVGQAINPQQVTGQIEGAVVQALGYTLLENFKTREGQVLTDRLSTYLIPTVLDVPERLESIIVEVPDPNGPFGARDGRNALSACGGGRGQRRLRRHRRALQRLPADAGTRVAGFARH